MSACVCGLDVHKESTYATILSPEGKIVNQMKLSIEKVLSYLSRFNVGKVAMESSNQVAALYRKLENKGYTVIVSHPKKTRYIADSARACIKIDPDFDALDNAWAWRDKVVKPGTIAEFVVTGFIGDKMIGGINLTITKK